MLASMSIIAALWDKTLIVMQWLAKSVPPWPGRQRAPAQRRDRHVDAEVFDPGAVAATPLRHACASTLMGVWARVQAYSWAKHCGGQFVTRSGWRGGERISKSVTARMSAVGARGQCRSQQGGTILPLAMG